MPPLDPPDGSAEVLAGVKAQLAELQPGLLNIAQIVGLTASLKQLKIKLSSTPGAAALAQQVDPIVAETPDAHGDLSDFGAVLGDLYALQQDLIALNLSPTDLDPLQSILLGIISQCRQLLNFRPDVGAILDDLTAVKRLAGGPADATSFHDFNVLQLAFRDVWMHAFSDKLKLAARELYEQTVRLYSEAGMVVPDVESLSDVSSLKAFLAELSYSANSPCTAPPQAVTTVFGAAAANYLLLTPEQQAYVTWQAQLAQGADTQEARDAAKATGLDVLGGPLGPGGRLAKLVSDIGDMMSEPYAFDVFAQDSYNYGLMITYRQQWEPGAYQAGNLVSTIPLAPGETRKFTIKHNVKETRARKAAEKSTSDLSQQFATTQRAEAEIMQKVVTATNFKLTAHGSFNFSFGNIDTTSEFSGNQSQDSTQSKKSFHEATLKAAEEYKQERSLEIDTTTTAELEETQSGEISNPNNELTVTYLYYELQRRYKIREFLYRVRPVILVAQEVPGPDQIDEAWLIQNQWILARVLLDESLRPGLNYLTSGFAGDEVSAEVLKVQWETQRALVAKLENLVDDQIKTRDVMRQVLVGATQAENMLPEMPGALKLFTLGVDPTEGVRGVLDSARQAGETRLKYVEEALADAQEKLKDATVTFNQVTKDYVAALQNKYSRHIAIDQLRLHVKQNIFYYMQAIWDHEPPDQRFFRLYNKKVLCIQPEAGGEVAVNPNARKLYADQYTIEFSMPPPGVGAGAVELNYDHELIEIADLDNPLGYKGNYIIFPLKEECYLTTYMLANFMDNYLGALDPDGADDFDPEDFEQQWLATAEGSPERQALADRLKAYITEIRRTTDEVIVPTGQLFVEALPGTHALLEDFKLLHRAEDVRKVKAEVRHAELENLRLAARLVEAQRKPALLEDPDIDKKIIFEGKTPGVAVDPGP